MILNRPVLAVIAITSGLLIWALSSGKDIRDADRTGAMTMNKAPSLSDQALFARNLDQVRQLKRLVPLQQLENDTFSRTIGNRLRAHFLSQDLIDGNALSSGRTVVSLVIAEDDLNGTALGIVPNNFEKGSAWERPGLISIYRDQHLVLRARAGVRIHGGALVNSPYSSFRLYFRDAYGAPDTAMSEVIPGAPGQLRRLIINKTDRAFRNAIAFSISRRIGGIAPHTLPAVLYLNGVAQGPRLLTEHVGLDFLESRFGHRDFTFLRMKGGTRSGHGSRWQTLTDRLNRQKSIKLADANTVIDMDNLMRQYAAFLICATGDAFQGAIVKDDRAASNRWFFVNWDMEGSFGLESMPDYFSTLGYGTQAPPVLRPALWRKLRHDEEFRTQFSKLMADLFDNVLTREWFDATIAHYRRTADAVGITEQTDLDQVESFLRVRPQELRGTLADFLTGKTT